MVKSSLNQVRSSDAINPGFKHDESLLKSALTGHIHKSYSDNNLSSNPRTSMSQLKLTQLAFEQNKLDDDLQDFSMKELRDGYFDPIYTKPEKLPKRDIDLNFRKKFSWGFNHSLNSYIKSYTKNWIILSKFSIGFIISYILCLINKSGNWFGDYRVFLPIATLIHHPVHAVGTQIEMTIQSITGLAIGLGWSSLALYISTATQPTRNHQGGILFGSLFLGLFVMGWFKGYMIRFYYMLLTSGIVLIFLSTNLYLVDSTIVWKNCWNIAIPYLFGLLVSLFVSIVYFPYLGSVSLMDSITETTSSITNLLNMFTKIDTLSSKDDIINLQNEAVNSTLKLSENFREFLSSFKFSSFDQEDLKEIRNHLNFVVSPLRVIPFQTNIYFKDILENPSSLTTQTNTHIPNSNIMSAAVSGISTPIPRTHMPLNLHLHPKYNEGKEFVYVSIMNDTFSKPMIKLLLQMIESIENIEKSLKIYSKEFTNHDLKLKSLENLSNSKKLLKKKMYQLDLSYRKFSRSEYFCRALLEQEQVINIFLFLRYSRQSSVGVISLIDVVIKSCKNVSNHPKFTLPNYPLQRSLRRLTEQCLRDQGADSIFRYLESKMDVDGAFERIYNLNTSRNKHQHLKTDKSENQNETKTIRAIDHHDFNFHSTKNKYQFKLWEFSTLLLSYQSKYAFKVSFAVIFLSLPSWLKVSWNWYYTYNCYWCPILVYYFLSPRNSGTWINLILRLICCILGCFWGWLSNEAGKFSSKVVIGIFAGIFVIVFSHFFLVDAHPRSSLIGLLSFTIISLHVNVSLEKSTESIWKHAWILSIALIISILTSIFSNWLIWPFIAKNEIYSSYSSLIGHIAQSYQSVSERYLYRDENDDPTDLTLELANIREVRMSQNLVANKELLERAVKEHDFRHDFNPKILNELLNSCHSVLENLIEARMSSIYFHVWEQDEDEATTRELLSLRRDSISTVIYLLYIVSNSIRTKSKIPKYLPSAISIRKKLFNLISKLELTRKEHEPKSNNILDQLNEKLAAVQSSRDNEHNDTDNEKEESYTKIHWKEVHGMAFARAFTSITKEVEEIVRLCKELLGEEELFDELGI